MWIVAPPAASWHQKETRLLSIFSMTSCVSKFGKVLQLLIYTWLILYDPLLNLYMIFFQPRFCGFPLVKPQLITTRWWPFKGTHCFPAWPWHRVEWRPCRICRVPTVDGDGEKPSPWKTPWLGKPNYRAKCKNTYKLGEKMVKKNGFKF